MYICSHASAHVWIHMYGYIHLGFPDGSDGKASACNAGDPGSNPGKILWKREWQSMPVFLPGKFHGQRSLAGYVWSLGSHRDEHDWSDLAQRCYGELLAVNSVSFVILGGFLWGCNVAESQGHHGSFLSFFFFLFLDFPDCYIIRIWHS